MLPTTIFVFGFVQAVILARWESVWFWWLEVAYVAAAVIAVAVWLVHQNFGGSPR